jgi:hypothetical protein
MGLELFGSAHNDEAADMERRLRSATAKDRKLLKNGDRSSTVVAAMKGVVGKQTSNALHAAEVLRWVKVIRVRFAGVVIHRTVWSVDYQDRRISGLEPFQEHYIIVKLYDAEYAHLESMAHLMVAEKSEGKNVAVSVSDLWQSIRQY